MAWRRGGAGPAPRVIAVGGGVASGKSHVSAALAEHLCAEHLEADEIREEKLAASTGAAAAASRGAGLGARSWERGLDPLLAPDVYAKLRRRVEGVVAEGRDVIVAACFPRQAQREGMRKIARDAGGAFLFVECRPGDGIARERLAAREARGEPGWRELAEALAEGWEPVEGFAPLEQLALDTGRPVEVAAEDVLARLEARRPPAAADPDAGAVPRWKAVSFDCWNTLIFEPRWEEAHARRIDALVAAAAEAGREVSREAAGTAFDAAWARHMALWREGLATGAREVALWALAELGLREPHPALEHLVRRFEEASHSEGVEVLTGARDTLERLAQHGIGRALVCDTGLTPGRVVRRHLERHGLLALLDVTVFSDEIGVPKPDPRAFAAALQPLGGAPSHALHVGDLRRTDVAGARAVGMWSARILERHDDASELPEADFVVDTHADLLALLDKSTCA